MINVLEIGMDTFTYGDIKRQELLQKRRLESAKYLKSYQIIFYSPEKINNKLGKAKGAENLEVYYISKPKLLFPFRTYKIGVKICQQKRMDVITVQDPFISGLIGYFLKKKFKIPLNIQIHSDNIDNPLPILKKRYRFYQSMARYLLRKAELIRVVSPKLKEKIISFGIPKERIMVVPTPIDISRFEKADGSELRKKLLGSKFKKIILFVGRLSPEKNLPFLLKSFALVVGEYPSALLVIVGSGKEENKIKILARKLNIEGNVLFTGSVNYSEIPQYYAALDVFVLTSIGEGRASVLTEAASAKKPIITTNFSAAEDCVIDNKTGFIIKQGDFKGLQNKILFLLNNPEMAKQFGESGNFFIKEELKEINSVEALVNCWTKTAQIKKGIK